MKLWYIPALQCLKTKSTYYLLNDNKTLNLAGGGEGVEENLFTTVDGDIFHPVNFIIKPTSLLLYVKYTSN